MMWSKIRMRAAFLLPGSNNLEMGSSRWGQGRLCGEPAVGLTTQKSDQRDGEKQGPVTSLEVLDQASPAVNATCRLKRYGSLNSP